jgi:diguanylate cyclase (GGDEF)-like protein/PAS domain S-box-containing protein
MNPEHIAKKEKTARGSDASMERVFDAARMTVYRLAFEDVSLAQTLETLIGDMEKHFPDWRVAVWLFNETRRMFALKSAPSMDKGYCSAPSGALEDYGCARHALQAATPLFLDNITQAAECACCPQRVKMQALQKGAGFSALWSLPLTDAQGDRLGVMNFYACHTSPPDANTQANFQRFATEIGRAAAFSEQAQQLRRAQAVLAISNDGVIITDEKTRIVFVNKTWCDMSGYSHEEAIGRTPALVKSDVQGQQFYQAMWAALSERDEWRGEIINRNKNGETSPKFLSVRGMRVKGTLTHYVGVITDLSHLKQSEREREQLAHYDPLTHLPNRLLARSRLEFAIEEAERNGDRVGLLYVDLDRFKIVNDSLGHPVGDQILQRMARRIRERVRGKDTLARLGGDEFMLILAHVKHPDEVARMAQIVLDLLRQPVRIDDKREIFIGASVGVSLYPEDGKTATDLIQHADTAMYHAKKLGRNTFCFYTAQLSIQMRQRLHLETQMHQALENGEFKMFYQPQVDIESGRVTGVEALMRWESPEFGSISPIEFIPVSEQSGLILSMGAWAMNEACAQAKRWLDEGLPPISMAVNVSVLQFRSNNLLTVVEAALRQSGLPAHCLEIELTESAFCENVEEAITITRALHDIGVRLALDDFGTGYSSLAYLSRFPLDKIKIDQSFVRDITSNPINAAIANAIIALAQSLRMSVLAEGVESDSQLNFLRQRGCTSIQGFFFSYPLDADACATFLREGKPLTVAPTTAERTLLLIDDEPNILHFLQRLLRQDGYTVLTATDPDEALELLAKSRAQVVVSDQRMPKMSGTEFLSRVRQLHPDTLRIVLSDYSDIKLITQAINQGVVYKFFTKPCDEELLRNNIREAFRVAEKCRISPERAPG